MIAESKNMTKLTLVIGNKNYSSWSLRAWLAIKQAGLEFAEVRIPLDGSTTHEEIRRYSPSGKVPVLIDGDLKVWESLAICEYVAERFASDLWPTDVAETGSRPFHQRRNARGLPKFARKYAYGLPQPLSGRRNDSRCTSRDRSHFCHLARMPPKIRHRRRYAVRKIHSC